MYRDMYFTNMLSYLPELILGLIVLLIGFFIAKAVENAVSKRLKKSRVNERLNVKEGKWNVEKIISKVVFFGILLLAFLLFFNIMNASMIASPFMTMYSGIGGAVLSILKAGLILLLAWVFALIGKKVVLAIGGKMKLNKYVVKVGASPDEIDKSKWVETAANIAFYVVLLLFVPAVLHALGLSGISGPFEGMLSSFMSFFPKLVGAALIFAVGWVVAKIIRTIVTKLLESVGVDRFSHKLKLSSGQGKVTSISDIVGTIVFVLIMLPVTISALEVLDLEGISQPAIAMLNDIMTMLPKIAVAIVLVLVGIYLAKWVKGIVVSLLNNLGINSIFGKMGVRSGASTPSFSQIIGTIVQVIVILLFVVEALQLLNLTFMVTLATGIFAYLPMVVAAVVILAIGFWLAHLAEKFVGSILTTKSGSPHVLRYVAKYAILAFAFFMALSQLGIAPAIINAAFILILGGVALAFGLAFGLGGREHASRYLTKMEGSLQEADVSKEKWEQEKSEMKREVKRSTDKAQRAVDRTAKEDHVPSVGDKGYPTEQDYEPRTGQTFSDELPLSDPADSNTSDAFEENDPTRFNQTNKDGYNTTDPGEEYPYDPNRGNK
ncbi:mechanosensitive ion channel [Sporosarcina thermotolerans]|uniref:Mechanosensitive ion channel n=1 Tax=Sporosarcina thermotolerans TaxID=633404 RepID=A0AAW9AGM5_9BACL|nr:mechanosensitive ion channel [Sporosarcina thermotolerans]MDW0118836.1 mechanosensitive ion channel [Sporosarcina thermotolerans]WHT48525.1 mechanosensitive ion channel [Sporosarcina thermotolerans]